MLLNQGFLMMKLKPSIRRMHKCTNDIMSQYFHQGYKHDACHLRKGGAGSAYTFKRLVSPLVYTRIHVAQSQFFYQVFCILIIVLWNIFHFLDMALSESVRPLSQIVLSYFSPLLCTEQSLWFVFIGYSPKVINYMKTYLNMQTIVF